MTTIAAIPKKVPRAKTYSLWEYLAREERAKDKHEFYNGIIAKMANAKFNHNLIAMNMAHALLNALKKTGKKYLVLGDGQKVYIESENIALYPDALVIFEKPIFFEGRQDMLVNPIMIVEVLSRSTSLYDRTSKFDFYQEIPSFKEYVLIDSKKIKVETRYREEQDLWRITAYTTENQQIKLKSLDIFVEMDDIYENVEF
jgi:Uma2 family endonuclease